ncbi:hypothetical protein [Roseofilum sp. Guam]|uniref:hypothetical protein n=1 Tax=Roseofilum sp. Guam TaxID=2821502 RepID=UPI001AFD03A7|nr:hypothetical protein [Roseofilum sp. Guam]MBP0027324.1 hypothetical protein [Roseofilum sp. Guam]
MSELEPKFCFSTLALGQRYRNMARDLAGDIETYFPGTSLVVFTDKTLDFKEQPNVIPFKHRQQGIQHCYNDKRFLLEKSLSLFPSAIHLDADTRVFSSLSVFMELNPGLAGRSENLIEHVKKYRPENLADITKVASKLEIDLESALWIGESLFIVTRDGGKEAEFFHLWGLIGRYLELKGMHSGEGNIIGLAAAKIGWGIEKTQTWQSLVDTKKHLDASHQRNLSSLEKLQRRIAYHYRLNKERLQALRDFDFYYR